MSDYDTPADEARAFLLARGVDEDAIEHAAKNGRLHLLVMERLLLDAEPRYTQAELAELAGMPLEQTRRFWRALGFPDVPEGDRAFTEHDLNALSTVNGMIHLGITDEDAAVQMSRVIGGSMAKIAEATLTSAPVVDSVGESERTAELYALTAGSTLEGNARLLEYVWRRHLQAAVRRAVYGDAPTGEKGRVVGFADLVGFTALSQQLSEEALAEVVGAFEEKAYDTVISNGGRVVKMIGDEVMFVVDEPAAGPRIGLALSEAYHDDDVLSDLRVGMAYGPVLAREGDLYGPVVNLASRLVNIARPGSVLASKDLHDALEDNDEFGWRALRTRYLKDLGRVPVWAVLHPEEEPEPAMRGRARIRRRPGVLLPVPEPVRRRAERRRHHGGHDADEPMDDDERPDPADT